MVKEATLTEKIMRLQRLGWLEADEARALRQCCLESPRVSAEWFADIALRIAIASGPDLTHRKRARHLAAVVPRTKVASDMPDRPPSF